MIQQQSTADLEITTDGISFEGEDWVLIALALMALVAFIAYIRRK